MLILIISNLENCREVLEWQGKVICADHIGFSSVGGARSHAKNKALKTGKTGQDMF